MSQKQTQETPEDRSEQRDAPCGRCGKALRESEIELKKILDSVSDHIRLIDRDFTVMWANETAMRTVSCAQGVRDRRADVA